MRAVFIATALTLGAIAPQTAQAERHDIYYAQVGALLRFAKSEAVILHDAVTAKIYDPKITTEAVEGLRRALQQTKQNLDRSIALLPKKYSAKAGALEKLRTKLSRCEDTLTKVANDIEEQTSRTEVDDADETGGELGTRVDDDEPEPPPRAANWKLLKAGVSWVYFDLKAIQDAHKKLGKKIGVKPLPRMKRPAGKHP